MSAAAEVGTLIVRIPVEFKRRRGRKLIITPEGVTNPVAPPAGIDDTLVRTLLRCLVPAFNGAFLSREWKE
ncbi:MAG: hypothetical protein WCJ64_19270, partial [Rhodospirillaceae bacterium]